MKFAIALGLFSALAQAGLAQKCIERPSSSAPEELSTSTTDIVYSAVPMPSEYSEPQSDTAGPSSTAPAMYSTIPMPSNFSETYLDTSEIAEATTTTDAEEATTSETEEAATTSEVYVPASSSSSSSADASPSASSSTGSSSAYYQITLDDLNKAVPDRAGDDSCSAATYASECATNSRAVTAINNALTKYQISGRGEAVAVIALMAFESDSWLYNINHNPGNPGQGTRNMQMYTFNSEYAQLLYPTQVAAATAANASGTASQENAVLDLVLDDDDSFGSGFWYLVNHASGYYNNANKLRDGNSADFQDYITNGVGATWTNDRLTTWSTVNSALSS